MMTKDIYLAILWFGYEFSFWWQKL